MKLRTKRLKERQCEKERERGREKERKPTSEDISANCTYSPNWLKCTLFHVYKLRIGVAHVWLEHKCSRSIDTVKGKMGNYSLIFDLKSMGDIYRFQLANIFTVTAISFLKSSELSYTRANNNTIVRESATATNAHKCRCSHFVVINEARFSFSSSDAAVYSVLRLPVASLQNWMQSDCNVCYWRV